MKVWLNPGKAFGQLRKRHTRKLNMYENKFTFD